MVVLSSSIVILKTIFEGLEILSNPDDLMIIIFISLIVAFILGLLILLKHKKPISEPLRSTTVIALGICIIVILTSISFWSGSYWQKQALHDIPLKVLFRYDFEEVQNPIDIKPWHSVPQIKKYELYVSDKVEFAHSGTNSPCVKVYMKAYTEENKDTEYGGIGVTKLGLRGVKAITVWVLIPESDQSRNIEFRSHIFAFLYDKNGEPFGFYSEEKYLIPGVWTPIFLGVFSKVEYDHGPIWREFRTLDEIFITVRSDEPYVGPICFDDITIYTDKEGLKELFIYNLSNYE